MNDRSNSGSKSKVYPDEFEPDDDTDKATDADMMLTPNDSDQTVHMWALVRATTPSVANLWTGAIMPLLLSLLVNMLKVLVLGSMNVDAVAPRCQASSDCAAGQFCSESWRHFCVDCALASLDNTSSATAYCAQDDPDVCDYVEAHRKDLNLLDICLVIFAGMLMAQMILVDLGQLAREQHILAHLSLIHI